MDAQTTTLAVAVLALLGTALNSFLGLRGQKVAAGPGSESAIHSGFGKLVDGLEKRVDGLAKEIQDCHDKHAECEEGRREDKEQHRAQMEALRAEFERLAAQSAPPDYKPEDLKRVGGRRS